jgi:hypothetical protein
MPTHDAARPSVPDRVPRIMHPGAPAASLPAGRGKVRPGAVCGIALPAPGCANAPLLRLRRQRSALAV